jgi:ABC-type multidrug transport system ATPase subunit
MFGLLGPNGAGKSTLMRILATLQSADSGRARLGEIDVLADHDAVRRTLGYLPQEFGLYPRATAEQMLDHFALLKGLTHTAERRETVAALLQQTTLYAARRQKLGGFSGGMRQRFGIAVALIGNPRLIIVDEPTAGLDPAERARFLNLLSELGENAVVILSTHIVEDVSDLCTRMAVIEGGRILLEGDPADAVHALSGRVWRRQVDRAELPDFQARFPVISTTLVGGRTVIHVHGHAAPDPSFEPVEADLKDVYFTVIGGIPLQDPAVAPASPAEEPAEDVSAAGGPVTDTAALDATAFVAPEVAPVSGASHATAPAAPEFGSAERADPPPVLAPAESSLETASPTAPTVPDSGGADARPDAPLDAAGEQATHHTAVEDPGASPDAGPDAPAAGERDGAS